MKISFKIKSLQLLSRAEYQLIISFNFFGKCVNSPMIISLFSIPFCLSQTFRRDQDDFKESFYSIVSCYDFFYCAVCNNICTYAPDGRKRTITTGVVAPAATLLLQGQVTSAFIDLLTPSLWIVAISKTKLSMFFCLSGGRRPKPISQRASYLKSPQN